LSEILEIRKRAHEYAQAGDLDNALQEYRKLLKGDDVDPNIYNLMGDVHFKKGDAHAAFRQYEEAVRKYGKDNLYSNAIAVCRKMLRLNPGYIDAHRLLGDLYFEQGFGGEAVGYFLEYAGKLIDKGDLGRAVDSLKRIIEFAPDKVKVREQLAEVYTHLGLADEARSELIAAEDIYRRTGDREMASRLKERVEQMGGTVDVASREVSVEGEGTDRVEIVHNRIGLAHHVPVKMEEVLRSFREEVAKAIGEEDYQSHYDLGISYLDLGLLDEALAEFGVSRKHPDLALRSIELAGRCFVEKGDVDLAIEELKAGLETEGSSESECLGLRYILAMAYEKTGQVEEARECYAEVCESDPDYRDVKVRLEKLSKDK
jgi:tetratricopeptide (TPR) repeat protein